MNVSSLPPPLPHPPKLAFGATVTHLGDGRQERRQHSPSGSWTTWERDFKNNIFKNRILLATLGFLFYFDSDNVMRTKMGCDNMVSFNLWCSLIGTWVFLSAWSSFQHVVGVMAKLSMKLPHLTMSVPVCLVLFPSCSGSPDQTIYDATSPDHECSCLLGPLSIMYW